MNRIEDVLSADDLAHESSESNNAKSQASGQTPERAPTSTTISDFMGWEPDQEDT